MQLIPPIDSFSRLAYLVLCKPTSLILPALLAAAVTLSACGEEDAKLLPGETAREITANLDTVQQLADEGDCIGAESATEQVGEQIESLRDVDAELKRTLEKGAARLDEVVAGCEELETEAIAPAEEPASDEDEEADEEKEAEEREKEEEKQERDEEKEAEKEAREAEREESEPPHGKAKGHEGTPPPAEEEGGQPSGGVSPGSAVGEGDDGGEDG